VVSSIIEITKGDAMAIQIILYDGWLQKIMKKDKKRGLKKEEIRALLKVCSLASRVSFLSNGIIFQIK